MKDTKRTSQRVFPIRGFSSNNSIRNFADSKHPQIYSGSNKHLTGPFFKNVNKKFRLHDINEKPQYYLFNKFLLDLFYLIISS